MTRLLPALAAALCIGSVAWGAPQAIVAGPDVSAFQAQVRALASTMPQPCTATPLPDTLQGTIGAGTPCTLRSDTARPTVVQAANVVTDNSGNWTV